MNWTTVFVSISSVVTGSVLTMLGQVFADRRARGREREIRRENYYIAIFERRRDALLKVQELVLMFSPTLRSERVRRLRSNNYLGYDPIAKIAESNSVRANQRAELCVLTERLKLAETQEEQYSVLEESTALADRMRETWRPILAEDEKILTLASQRRSFSNAFFNLVQNICIQTDRTDSQRAVLGTQRYIDAVWSWHQTLDRSAEGDAFDNIEKAIGGLKDVVRAELKQTPFDY